MHRLLRLVVAASCPGLALAHWWELSARWTLPLAAVCCVNAMLAVAEHRSTHPDGHVVLNLHR